VLHLVVASCAGGGWSLLVGGVVVVSVPDVFHACELTLPCCCAKKKSDAEDESEEKDTKRRRLLRRRMSCKQRCTA